MDVSFLLLWTSILTAARLIIFYSINNGYDTITWQRMVVIKQKILQIWDSAGPSVRICCIKFAQRVVLAQSVASGAELRVRLRTIATH